MRESSDLICGMDIVADVMLKRADDGIILMDSYGAVGVTPFDAVQRSEEDLHRLVEVLSQVLGLIQCHGVLDPGENHIRIGVYSMEGIEIIPPKKEQKCRLGIRRRES